MSKSKRVERTERRIVMIPYKVCEKEGEQNRRLLISDLKRQIEKFLNYQSQKEIVIVAYDPKTFEEKIKNYIERHYGNLGQGGKFNVPAFCPTQDEEKRGRKIRKKIWVNESYWENPNLEEFGVESKKISFSEFIDIETREYLKMCNRLNLIFEEFYHMFHSVASEANIDVADFIVKNMDNEGNINEEDLYKFYRSVEGPASIFTKYSLAHALGLNRLPPGFLNLSMKNPAKESVDSLRKKIGSKPEISIEKMREVAATEGENIILAYDKTTVDDWNKEKTEQKKLYKLYANSSLRSLVKKTPEEIAKDLDQWLLELGVSEEVGKIRHSYLEKYKDAVLES